jgi:hypothetical protein
LCSKPPAPGGWDGFAEFGRLLTTIVPRRRIMAGLSATLAGPNVQQSALTLAKQTGIGTISDLTVFYFTKAAYPPLLAALKTLKAHFAADGCVTIYGDTDLMPPDMMTALSAAAGVPVSAPGMFAMMRLVATDMAFRDAAGNSEIEQLAPTQPGRWRVMQDVQTKIFNVTTDVTTNRKAAAQKAFSSVSGYIRG